MSDLTIDQVATALADADWTFAKTMPENPHHYTLRKRWTADIGFDDVVLFIRQHGNREQYKGAWYTVLAVGSFRYWTMGAPVPQTILINRKPLGQP